MRLDLQLLGEKVIDISQEQPTRASKQYPKVPRSSLIPGYVVMNACDDGACWNLNIW
jgi:hypothetical protein